MPGIHKSYLYTVCNLDFSAVFTPHKLFDHIQSILHGIRRYKIRLSVSLSLAVTPLSLEHLNMRTVTKHDVTQVAGSICRINRSPESFCISQREIAGMVNVGMGQQCKIHLGQCHRNLLVFILIRPLLHSTVHQKLLPRRLQEITTSRNLMSRTYKSQFHKRTPFAVI